MKDLEVIYNKWISLLPLSDKKQAQLVRKFTVEYNYNSNHIVGNTLTYGQTELLLLFDKVSGEAEMKDFKEMKASNVGLKMMTEVAKEKTPLTETLVCSKTKPNSLIINLLGCVVPLGFEPRTP